MLVPSSDQQIVSGISISTGQNQVSDKVKENRTDSCLFQTVGARKNTNIQGKWKVVNATLIGNHDIPDGGPHTGVSFERHYRLRYLLKYIN